MQIAECTGKDLHSTINISKNITDKKQPKMLCTLRSENRQDFLEQFHTSPVHFHIEIVVLQPAACIIVQFTD